LGQRSRKRRRPAAAAPRGYARSRARDEAARAALEPLAPGERPGAVTVAAVLAALIALSNPALYLAGWEVSGSRPSVPGMLLFSAILGAAAVGLWLSRYWAVLGFQVLLGVLLVFAGLSLLLASNWRGALLSLAVIVVAGALFWKLVRAMARIQMPQRPRRETPR
jgi:hypothetical protein